MAKDAATATALIEKAQASFLEHGFENTSLRAIAQEAGMTTGAVYHYFRGKDGPVRRSMPARISNSAPTSGRGGETDRMPAPPPERIVAFLDAYYAFFLENSGYFELIEQFEHNAETLKINPQLRRRVQDASRVAIRRVREALGHSSPASAAKAELLASLAQGVIRRMRIGAFKQAGVSFGEIRRLCGEMIRYVVESK